MPFIDYVLIDPSGGLKKPFDPEIAIPILRAIFDRHFLIRLGIAGGLGPGKLDHLKPVVEVFPNISIDVEGGVRTPQPEDALDMWMVPAFIQQSVQMLYPNMEV